MARPLALFNSIIPDERPEDHSMTPQNHSFNLLLLKAFLNLKTSMASH